MVVVAVVLGSDGVEEVCGEDPRSSFLMVMTALFDSRVENWGMFNAGCVPDVMLLWLSGFKAEG